MDPGNKIPQGASAAITAAIAQTPPRKRAQHGRGLLLQNFGNRLLAQCISTTSISPHTLQSDYVRDWISHITDGKYQLPCKDESVEEELRRWRLEIGLQFTDSRMFCNGGHAATLNGNSRIGQGSRRYPRLQGAYFAFQPLLLPGMYCVMSLHCVVASVSSQRWELLWIRGIAPCYPNASGHACFFAKICGTSCRRHVVRRVRLTSSLQL